LPRLAKVTDLVTVEVEDPGSVSEETAALYDFGDLTLERYGAGLAGLGIDRTQANGIAVGA